MTAPVLIVSPHAIAVAALFYPNDDVRTYLTGVRFDPVDGGGVCLRATDGHRAIHVIDWEGTCEAPVCLRFDSQAVTKMRAQSATEVEVRPLEGSQDRYLVQLLEREGKSHLSQAAKVEQAGRADGYVDFSSIMPKTLPAATDSMIGVNGQYLYSFVQAAKILSPRYPGIVIRANHLNGPLYITFNTSDNRLFARGALMQLRLKDSAFNWNPERPQ